MRPLITPKHYTDPAIFAQEMEVIFAKRWICVGVTNEVANHHDYKVIEIGGRSIIIQNFDGEIKAFDNYCSHRFSRLHTDPCGNRQLKCPYHGWIYNGEGIPYGIPQKPRIREITPENVCEYRLSRWHVRTLGIAIFIKKETHEPLPEGDFEAQFADYYDELKRYASTCGRLLGSKVHRIKANWKVSMENTLEGYHVDCVHPTTLAKAGVYPIYEDPFAGKPTEEDLKDPNRANWSYFTFSKDNTSLLSIYKPEMLEKAEKLPQFIKDRPVKPGGYTHYFVFPNYVSLSDRGFTFLFQIYIPVDHETTDILALNFETAGLPTDLSKRDEAFRKMFFQGVYNVFEEVIAEDAAICETVQLGLKNAKGRGALSDDEARICGFHEAYTRALNGE